MLTPDGKKTLLPPKDDDLLTDDESMKRTSTKPVNKNTIIKETRSNLLQPRIGLKRSATLKSTPTTKPTVEIKRNKTNEFTTPQSIKKLSRPLNFGSAGKKLMRLPMATVTKSTLTNGNKLPTISTLTSINQFSKLRKPDDHLEAPSQTARNNFHLASSSTKSSLSSQASASSLKSCPSTAQQNVKAIPRLNANNVNSEGKQRCFGESALKQKLEEEKKRKLLEQKIAKEAEAKLKKDKFLQQRALETKSKREERERKVREGKLQHDAEVEQRRQEELRKKIELEKQAEEAKRIEELKRQQEELKRQEELKKQQQEEELKRQQEELKKQIPPPQSATKKVGFSQDYNEDLQTKCFEKLEKKIIEDQMKCKNTPMKQLVVEAVGKTNAEKSLYKPEIDPSLDVINLSLSSSDSSISVDDDESIDAVKETTSNCTFIKDIENKALSSTFIKPQIKNPTISPLSQKQQIIIETIKTPPSPIVLDNYDISDLRSDDDDDEDEPRVQNKRIPNWAKGTDFLKAIKSQFTLRVRERENQIRQLFLSIDSEIKLDEVFRGSTKAVSKKYERRTSSACWNSPPAVHIDHSFSRFH